MAAADPFRHYLRVRYVECDAQKVVFNSRYSEYVDAGMTEFLRAAGIQHEFAAGPLDFQLVKQTIEWRAPAHFDEVLELSMRATRLGTTSFTVATDFRLAGRDRVIAAIETVYVLVDATTLTKMPLPDRIRRALVDGAAGKATRQFADVSLARRLEGAERDANARFVEARASLDPASGAAWIDVNGTAAMFDGVDSPITQTFGFGLFAPPAAADLDRLERFFDGRSAPVHHEVCPLVDAAHLDLLVGRGYRPIEFSHVLYRRPAACGPSPAVAVRIVGGAESSLWAQTLADGWSDQAEAAPVIADLARVMAARAGSHLFLAEEDGRPIAAGSLSIADGVAILAGASTSPAARRRGAQSALLAARLAFAAEQGCDVAMVVALPGSGSQRNAERHGFRIAYTRTKWARRR
ncbi:MAG TPA: thioesterase family protein [Vicinamibacterales bacterium]|nr:thioesterase family protein [Vicinamibacterales bacterium]